MALPAPFVRESGVGPGVICLHSNASNSSQWRGLMDILSPNFHVLSPDSYGAGKSADWASDSVIRLMDEAEFVEPIFATAGAPLFIVGHSYGAAIALIVAMTNPQRVRALALYEPTLFSLIDAESPPPNGADGIRFAVNASSVALDEGNPGDAAKHFIDYWMGPSSWDNTPEARKVHITESIRNVRRWGYALLSELTPLDVFRTLDIPVLYMMGKQSPHSALEVARLLTGVLPNVEVVEFDGLGHMGPITHPQQVNEVIARFLASKAHP